MPRLFSLPRTFSLYVAPLTLRSCLRQRGSVFSFGLPRPYASARVSCGNRASRQRTGLGSVAPSTLSAWAALTTMRDAEVLIVSRLGASGFPTRSSDATEPISHPFRIFRDRKGDEEGRPPDYNRGTGNREMWLHREKRNPHEQKR